MGFRGEPLWWRKDVTKRNLLLSNFANLIPRRYGNSERPRWVYYIHSWMPFMVSRLVIIICHGVGWLRCLSLGKAMRRPDSGISEKYRFPRLFCIYINQPNLGEVYRQFILSYYGRKEKKKRRTSVKKRVFQESSQRCVAYFGRSIVSKCSHVVTCYGRSPNGV